jgi:hypothetical protein
MNNGLGMIWKEEVMAWFKVLSRYLRGGQENYENTQSVSSVSGPRLKPGTSRLRSRYVNHILDIRWGQCLWRHCLVVDIFSDRCFKPLNKNLVKCVCCSCWWCETELRLWTAASNGPIVHPQDDMCILRATVELYWQGNTEELWEKPVSPSSATLSTKYTWADVGVNPALLGERPTTNRLSHDTAKCVC